MSGDDWLTVLRRACEEASQAAVARRLGVSASVVNQALQEKYKGNLATLRSKVEGVLMEHVVDCPVLGEMAKHKCLEHQGRPRQFVTVNPLYVRLYRACRSGCPFSKLPKEF